MIPFRKDGATRPGMPWEQFRDAGPVFLWALGRRYVGPFRVRRQKTERHVADHIHVTDASLRTMGPLMARLQKMGG